MKRILRFQNILYLVPIKYRILKELKFSTFLEHPVRGRQKRKQIMPSKLGGGGPQGDILGEEQFI